MTIIVSDFYKDEAQAVEKAGLKEEIEYHLFQYGKAEENLYLAIF